MPSVFRELGVCLPFLFYEILKELGSKGVSQDTVAEAYLQTFGKAPSEEEVLVILDRLIKEANGKPEPSHRGASKRSFGTTFSQFLSSMDGERLCFLLADHDPVKAKELYCTVDMALVSAAAREKVGYLAELTGVWYEAVLFGMGGHYKGSGPNDNTYDISENPGGAKQRLSKLGLM